MFKTISIFTLALLLLGSCVSKKKFLAAENIAKAALEQAQKTEADCQQEKKALAEEKATLEQALRNKENELLISKTNLQNAQVKEKELNSQLDYFKSTNTDLLARLSDLSVISQTGAESIKKSLEALGEQNRYIRDLTASIQRKDSLNLVLVMNLKRSLDNINDEDITIEVKKGVVYISLSDKLLFKSGSYDINQRAEEVLGKIAKVVNDHKELDILVEGHTDNVPIKNACMKDNWDLSVMRATAVVRLLQGKYAIDAARMTAGGRSEYSPKASNENNSGRAENRRTEIIITPKLDQFMQLLSPPAGN